MWPAEWGPPWGCVPGLLREGSRLYSYLLRGNITALKPHNLLPHPAVPKLYRRPSHSPPALAVGHQSQGASRHRAGRKIERVAWQERPVPIDCLREASRVQNHFQTGLHCPVTSCAHRVPRCAKSPLSLPAWERSPSSPPSVGEGAHTNQASR